MKIAGALVRLIFRLPLVTVKFFLTHKVALLIVVAVVLFLGVRGQMGQGDEAADGRGRIEPEYYQLKAPPVVEARTVGQTESRVYYITRFRQDETTVTLEVWYDYNKDKWERHSTPLGPFNKSDIRLYQRG